MSQATDGRGESYKLSETRLCSWRNLSSQI